MARRHSSLIPLSRDHHDALALAFRLRHPSPPGPATAMTPPSTADERARDTIDFFVVHLDGHFRAEEDVLFPAVLASPAADDACRARVADLVTEHRAMAAQRDAIAAALAAGAGLETALDVFAETLERHVRREERELFVHFDALVAEPDASLLAARIDAILGARPARACDLSG
ncbi:hemerythrin domain-containing protein, partial [Candidatus Binatia bacterium]|nr:hemerythrin domain-containing protein [Candidatus Binatia bacterium]